jgi:sialic acid synthase SpsE
LAAREAEDAGEAVDDHALYVHLLAPPETLNLKVVQTMQQLFPCPIGYSDHSSGVTASLVAVSLGLRCLKTFYPRSP